MDKQLSETHVQELAHDIRNVLCVISGRIRMLEKTLQHQYDMPKSASQHTIQSLNKAVHQASSLCDGFVQSNRLSLDDSELGEEQSNHTPSGQPSSDQPPAEIKMANLQDVVYDCCDMISPLLSPPIKLSISLQHYHDSVACDALQLQRVLLNLMKNGMESMAQSGGLLEISTGQTWLEHADMCDFICDGSRSEGEYMYVDVSDQGCGMDGQAFLQKQHVNPLSTLDLVHTNKQGDKLEVSKLEVSTKGSEHGYGLKSAMHIINAYHGLMQLDSQPGKGTNIRVFLPCKSMPMLLDGTAKPSSPVDQHWIQLMHGFTSRCDEKVVHSTS